MARGNTTDRGYGWEHQKARALALEEMREGEPCPYCGHPMYRTMQLDYDHYPPIARGGSPDGPRRLTHGSCNRRAGGVLGAQRRACPGSASVNSRAW